MNYKLTPNQLIELIKKQGNYWSYISPPIDDPTLEGIFVTLTPEKEIDTITIFLKDEIYMTDQGYESHASEYTIERNPPEEYTVYQPWDPK